MIIYTNKTADHPGKICAPSRSLRYIAFNCI